MNLLDFLVQGAIPVAAERQLAGRQERERGLLAEAERQQQALARKRAEELDRARIEEIRARTANLSAAQKPERIRPVWEREGFASEPEYLAFVRRQTDARTMRPQGGARVGVSTPAGGATDGRPAGPQLTPPQIEQINNLDNVINIATEAEGQMRRAISSGANATGRLFGVLPIPTAVRDIAGQGGREGASARQALGNLFSTIAQLRSGAAISASEMERLEAFLPTMNDDEELAQQKLNGVIRALRQLRATRMRNYSQYGRAGMGVQPQDLQAASDVYDQFGLERPE